MTYREKFDKFHEENPHVYTELVNLARLAHERGRRKFGIKMLFEVVRWNRFIQTNDPSFKLNNNHAPYYARLIMEQEADLAGLFNLREITS